MSDLSQDRRFLTQADIEPIKYQALEKLRKAGIPDEHLVWVVPKGALDGLRSGWGIPVEHVAGLSGPVLAYRLTEPDRETESNPGDH